MSLSGIPMQQMKEISGDAFDLSYMTYNPEQYENILMTKIGQVRELFATNISTDMSEVPLDIYRSPMAHCRFRCRFAVMLNTSSLPSAMMKTETKNVCPPALREPSSSSTGAMPTEKITTLAYAKWEHGTPSVMVKEFPIAAVPIFLIMPIVAEEIVLCEGNELTGGLQSIHFLCTYAGSIMVTLIYHNRTGKGDTENPVSEGINTESWRREAHAFRDRIAARYLDRYGQGPLDSCIDTDVPLLAEGTSFEVHIIGRSRNVKIVIDKDYLMERLDLSTVQARARRLAPDSSDPGVVVPAAMPRYVHYRQIEDGFTNPNALVNMCSLVWLSRQVETILSHYNERMALQSAAEVSSKRYLDMLELYCGNGNHTAVISKYLRSDAFAISGRVLAVESNENLCRVATENMKLNGCSNVEIMHCPSAFVTRTLLNTTRPKIAPIAGVGERNHLANQDCCFKSKQAPFHSYMFEIILVDPPRAGLDDITRKAVAKYPYILYISCSPTALHRDLLQVITRVFCLSLCVTHDLVQMAIFDHFPYTTNHLESGVFLRKKGLV